MSVAYIFVIKLHELHSASMRGKTFKRKKENYSREKNDLNGYCRSQNKFS